MTAKELSLKEYVEGRFDRLVIEIDMYRGQRFTQNIVFSEVSM